VGIRHTVVTVFLAAVTSLGVSSAQAVSEREQAIIDRIKPVGQVCLEGDASCAMPVAAASSGPRSGESVYSSACVACHDTGAGGAPMKGDVAAWGDRIAQGVDMLTTNAINGIRGMPARGTCMNCSDEEIRAAVEFIVDNSQ